jgi:hypothetical protein
MNRSADSKRRTWSRRRFVKLAAAAGAVTVAMPAVTLGQQPAAKTSKPAAKAPAKPAAAAGFTAAERKELARLTAQIEEGLGKLRAYPLLHTAEPASTFVALRAPKPGRPR